jgi:hypothetical protein
VSVAVGPAVIDASALTAVAVSCPSIGLLDAMPVISISPPTTRLFAALVSVGVTT